jgi:hypothetical protein
LILEISSRAPIGPGLQIQHFCLPEQRTVGRSALIDLEQVQISLQISPELLGRSFAAGEQASQPPVVNSGMTLDRLLESRPGGAGAGEPIFACNALHTNFVRGSGFVIERGQLFCKPPGATGLDGDAYQPLDGDYTCLALAPGPPRLAILRLQGNRLLDPAPWRAISGPAMVRGGRNSAARIPARLPAAGQTHLDEINFNPRGPERAAFTALGVDRCGRLIAASAFGGKRTLIGADLEIFSPGAEDGLTLEQMAEVMLALGAEDAILGGGSGDAQQFLRGQPTWASLPRLQANRIQTGGGDLPGQVRGLGAVLLAHLKSQ